MVVSGAVYSHLKFINFHEHLQALRDGRLLAPVHIRIKPINHCNHNCWYCAYRRDNLQLGQDMNESDVLPEGKMFEIADDLVDMGVKAVTFSGGGEPLLYKKMPEIVERLTLGGIKVAALTNGLALTGRNAEAFARHGTWIRISIDAWDDASYSAARQAGSGEFNRVLNNMRDFVASGTKCVLGISFIVTKDNYPHIPDFCAQVKELGVSHVSLSGVVVENDGPANNAYHRLFYQEALAKISEAQGRLVDGSFQITNHYHEMSERFDKPYHFCPFQQFQTVIGADCMIYTCHDKAYNVGGLLGSIKDRSFKDVWFSPECHERMQAIDPSVHCRHHCVAHLRNTMITELLSLDPDHAGFV